MRSPARKDARPLVKHSFLTMCVYVCVCIYVGKQWAKIDVQIQVSDFYAKLCNRRNRVNWITKWSDGNGYLPMTMAIMNTMQKHEWKCEKYIFGNKQCVYVNIKCDIRFLSRAKYVGNPNIFLNLAIIRNFPISSHNILQMENRIKLMFSLSF